MSVFRVNLHNHCNRRSHTYRVNHRISIISYTLSSNVESLEPLWHVDGSCQFPIKATRDYHFECIKTKEILIRIKIWNGSRIIQAYPIKMKSCRDRKIQNFVRKSIVLYHLWSAFDFFTTFVQPEWILLVLYKQVVNHLVIYNSNILASYKI